MMVLLYLALTLAITTAAADNICQENDQCPEHAAKEGTEKYCQRSWAKLNCKVTCGLCAACKDLNPECKRFARDGHGRAVYCQRDWARINCKETCGHCESAYEVITKLEISLSTLVKHVQEIQLDKEEMKNTINVLVESVKFMSETLSNMIDSDMEVEIPIQAMTVRIKEMVRSEQVMNERITDMIDSERVMNDRIKDMIVSERNMDKRVKVMMESERIMKVRIQEMIESERVMKVRIKDMMETEQLMNTKINGMAESEIKINKRLNDIMDSEWLMNVNINTLMESQRVLKTRIDRILGPERVMYGAITKMIKPFAEMYNHGEQKRNAQNKQIISPAGNSPVLVSQMFNAQVNVFFSAALSNKTRLQPGQVIQFDHVMVNEGGAYQPKTGVFTSPLAGFYSFTLSVSAASDIAADFRLRHDCNDVLQAFSQAAQSASNSLILKLGKGDKVIVVAQQLAQQQRKPGSKRKVQPGAASVATASFSGHLIAIS